MAIPQIIIAKYLSGEASLKERNELEEWRKESETNEVLFQELRDSWLLCKMDDQMTIPSKEHVWNNIVSNLQETLYVKMYTRSTIWRIVSISACVALILGFAISIFLPVGVPAEGTIVFKTPPGQKGEVVLSDGTKVWLNSGSALSYSNRYNDGNRVVQLEGEAFFDVMKNEKHPFSVLAGDLKINVLGTAFNVSANKKDSSIQISLLRGRITIEEAHQNKLLADMRPNEKFVLNKNSLQNTLLPCDAEMESLWKNGRLKLENASLQEAARRMGHWFGVNINVSGENRPVRYWLTIKTESLREMLELINKISPINYSIDGEEVQISYK